MFSICCFSLMAQSHGACTGGMSVPLAQCHKYAITHGVHSILSPFPDQIRWYRSTWTCTSNLAGTGLSSLIASAGASPVAREQMSPYLEKTSRWQNFPSGYSCPHCIGMAQFRLDWTARYLSYDCQRYKNSFGFWNWKIWTVLLELQGIWLFYFGSDQTIVVPHSIWKEVLYVWAKSSIYWRRELPVMEPIHDASQCG